MKEVLSIVLALALVLTLGLASATPVAAVSAPITVVVSNPLAGQLADYTIRFHNDSTLEGGVDYIDVMFPAGTDVTTVTGVTVTKGPSMATDTATPVAAPAWYPIGLTVIRIWPDDDILTCKYVRIVVDDVTNPAPGDYALCVGTSNTSPICSDESDANVVATHELTMAVDPTGSGAAIDVPAESPYEAGTVVNIKAQANEGYRFLKWTASAGVFADADAAETMFTMPGDTVTVTANFALIPLPTYNLTMEANPEAGGAATDESGTPPYEPGVTVVIKAVAASGYRFLNWTATPEVIFGNANAAETTFTMPDDAATVAANFVAVYDLTISATAGGSVATPGEGAFTYDEGEVVALVAEPEEGHLFVNWTGDASTVVNPNAASTAVVVDNAYSITANFEEEPLVSTGCFIATAAYGTPMAEEIQGLREFRDLYLLTNGVGRAFVNLYYSVSPPMAEFITEHPSLKPTVRAGLVPAVVMSTIVVNTAPAEKAAVAGLLVLLSVAMAVWATRRRSRLPEYT